MNYSKVGTSLKKVGTKDGAKTLLWLVVIALILFFSKKLFSMLSGLFGFFQNESTENLEIMKLGQEEFKKYAQSFDFNKTGVSQSLIDTEVAQAVQYMSGTTTDWTNLNKLVTKMTPVHFVGFFIKFGVKINPEFDNQAGDFIDWLNKEKKMSALTYVGLNPVSPIKDYLNRFVIPFISKSPSIQTRLKKINE